MICTNTLHGLGELGLGILDDMAFVQNTVVPAQWLEISDVVSDDFVRSDNDVILVQL